MSGGSFATWEGVSCSDKPRAALRMQCAGARQQHFLPRPSAYDVSRYGGRMSSAISVRLDDEAEKALRVLNACGLSTSDAIRSSLIESARRVRRSEALAREVAELEADEADRAEMLEVAGLMESLRAAR